MKEWMRVVNKWYNLQVYITVPPVHQFFYNLNFVWKFKLDILTLEYKRPHTVLMYVHRPKPGQLENLCLGKPLKLYTEIIRSIFPKYFFLIFLNLGLPLDIWNKLITNSAEQSFKSQVVSDPHALLYRFLCFVQTKNYLISDVFWKKWIRFFSVKINYPNANKIKKLNRLLQKRNEHAIFHVLYAELESLRICSSIYAGWWSRDKMLPVAGGTYSPTLLPGQFLLDQPSVNISRPARASLRKFPRFFTEEISQIFP